MFFARTWRALKLVPREDVERKRREEERKKKNEEVGKKGKHKRIKTGWQLFCADRDCD